MRMPKSAHHGFNLIELAIALGVMGLVMAGIFATYTSVVEGNRVNNAYRQIQQIVGTVRSMYPGTRPLEVGDYTRALLDARALPNDVMVGGTTVNPWGTTDPAFTPPDPPRAGVSVGSGMTWAPGCAGAGLNGNTVIQIVYWNIPQENRSAGKLLAKFIGPKAGTDVVCAYCDRAPTATVTLTNPRTARPDQVGQCWKNIVLYIRK